MIVVCVARFRCLVMVLVVGAKVSVVVLVCRLWVVVCGLLVVTCGLVVGGGWL